MTPIPFIDLHEDIAGARTHPTLKTQTDFEQLQRVDTKTVFGTGFTLPEETLESVIERDLAFYTSRTSGESQWRMVRTGKDVGEILQDPNAHGILFHIEGFPGITENWELLEKWHQKGWRSAGLVWNDDNPLGGGTDTDMGLTDFGRTFIAWCEERNILIDFAHMNPRMFADSLATIKRPPFISHGGLQSIVPHRRNYSDEQLREIARRGGLCGIFFAKSAMGAGGTFGVADIAARIKAAIDVAGEEGVALGTDFGGITSGTPDGLTSVTEIPMLWEQLRVSGLTDNQIELVAYRNAARYLKENLPS